MSESSTGKSGRKTWAPYLVRGIMAIVIAITLVRQFVVPGSKASNFPIYLGVYFIANGILGLRLARSGPDQKRLLLLSALTLIGGLALTVMFPFSDYRDSLVATDLGRYTFSSIVIIMGLIQAQGSMHMTPQPVVKQAHIVLGFLEILLGIVILASPIGRVANAVAFVWTVLVAVYMFYVARRLHGTYLVSAVS